MKNKERRLRFSKDKGSYLPIILIASTLFFALALAIVSIALSQIKVAKNHEQQVSAMEVAEAGINYYLWHLAHDNNDYCDGGECIGEGPYGPYIHDYTNQIGNVTGSYELTITPPDTLGGPVTVRSVGKVIGRELDRVIVATLGVPSFTKYSLFVQDSQLWLGEGEKVDGSVHVNNNGMYNEGEITGDASSTETTYNGWFGNQPGVAGPGIFGGAKIFPVPAADFNQVDINIAETRSRVRDEGEGQYIASSSRNRGYHIILHQNNFDLYEVRRFRNNYWYIQSENFIDNYDYPESGVIFVEDNVWVEGEINDQQITIFAADPDENGNNQKGIYIVDDIEYTNYDGTDKIGLVTQTDILLASNVPDDLEIDAAMIARYGEARIDYYPGQVKDHIRVYGSIAHNTGIVWTYGNPSTGQIYGGYRETELIIDESNVLNPPPMFPTTGSYAVLSWREE